MHSLFRKHKAIHVILLFILVYFLFEEERWEVYRAGLLYTVAKLTSSIISILVASTEMQQF